MSDYTDVTFLWDLGSDGGHIGNLHDYAQDMIDGECPGPLFFFDSAFGGYDGEATVTATMLTPRPAYRGVHVTAKVETLKRTIVRTAVAWADAEG